MFRFPELFSARLGRTLGLLLLACAGGGVADASDKYPSVGRAATPKEVAAWDIDVRPDFKGLPAGSGSVAEGQHIWEAKCASCHGVFGESNQVFSPLVGGTTEQDVRTGRVARLSDPAYPSRTTLMKVATLSTLWDYINRAMPWNQPKSLTANEVYAVTAYMLNLGNVLPDSFTLSDQNMVEVQARMPNRLGMTTAHALWPGSEFGPAAKADTPGSNCLRNCTAGLCVELLAEPWPCAGSSNPSAAAGRNVVGAGTGVVASDRSARSMCLAMASVRRSSYCAMRCLPASV